MLDMETKMHKLIPILILTLIGYSQAQFGQNIVQYDDYEWQYIQSAYFDIYFYGDDVHIAEFTSEVINEAYEQISDRLNWDLQKRVSIMVYRSHSDFQQTNVVNSYMVEGIGGVTEGFKNRIVVPFEGDWDAFYTVIRHELVHAIINDMIYGGNIQSRVNGRIRYEIPLWMNEGLAEYLASIWDSNSDMYMRDLALNGDIPPIQQLTGYYAYRGGQSIWRFIASKYGEESIAEIFEQIKRHSSVQKGLQEAIGTNYEQLHEKWEDYLKKQYYPDVIGRKNIRDIAQLFTDHEELNNVYNIGPSLSPDGSKLALLSNNYGNMELVLIDATTGKYIKSLIRGGTTSQFEELHILKPGIAWSPDGKKVAFAAKAASEDILYIIDVKTEKVEKYSSGLEGIFMATWSPTEDVIAFVGNNGINSDIYTLHLDTKEIVNISNDFFSEFNPSWSYNGEYIVYSSDRADYPIQRFDDYGNSYDWRIRFAPDGTPLSSVAPDFDSVNRDYRKRDLFMLKNDGTELKRLTDSEGADNFPVVAKSENKIFFTSDRSGINNIYMLDVDTGEERAVTNILTGVQDLNLSRDDNRLFFTGFEKGGYDIYLINKPMDMWNNPQEVTPSNYIVEKPTAEKNDLVNVDRGETDYGSGVDYSQYVFGVDNPWAFTPTIQDSVPSIVLDEETFKDDNGKYRVMPYKTKFTLDLVQSYAGYSTLYSFQGMTQFIFSDMLGDHRISIATEMQISLENSDYFLTYHMLPYRTNFYFTGFHTAFMFSSSQFTIERLRHFGLDLVASRPFNRFQRVDLGVTINAVVHTRFGMTGVGNFQEYAEYTMPTLLPHIGYTWDNAEWSYMYPVAGMRANIVLNVSPKIDKNGMSFQTISFDARKYFRLKGGTSIAARVSGGASFGANAQKFLAGGLPWIMSSEEGGQRYARDIFGDDNDPYASLQTIYFSKYLTPLRGTQMMELVGNKAIVANLEFRFPFLIYYFPALGMLGQLGGVIFSDYGAAWGEGVDVTGNLQFYDVLTYGWGPRFILFGLPLQLDYAWEYKKNLPDPKHWYLTIGLDF